MAKKKGPPPADPVPPLRLEWRSPAELAENPRNWRRHPDTQLAALTDVIAEVGWAGACLFNEATGRLIDGHARQKVALAQGTEKVPVLVGSWTEEQEAKILATLDPLAAMAGADAVALDALLKDVTTGSAALQGMLSELWEANQPPVTPLAPTDPANDPSGEWEGMPGFEHEDQTSAFRAIVHFANEADLQAFEELVGQTIPRNRWAIWYPEAEIERFSDKEYIADGEVAGERP